jgi:hypothetical protein
MNPFELMSGPGMSGGASSAATSSATAINSGTFAPVIGGGSGGPEKLAWLIAGVLAAWLIFKR